MRRAICAEWMKARRRHDLPLAVLVGLIAALGAGGGRARTAHELATGYWAMLVNLSLMNAVVMPLAMAALASRLWDIETKGCGCRLLFTLQSRESLFAAKALLGMGENGLVCLAECAGFLLLGRAKGLTQALEPLRAVWLLAGTWTVNAMIFFTALLMSVRSGTQVKPLAAGMACSLLGVFTAFMPRRLAYCTPWAYYVPLCAVEMTYDRAARTASYTPQAFPFPLLAAAALLGALALGMALRAVGRQEV